MTQRVVFAVSVGTALAVATIIAAVAIAVGDLATVDALTLSALSAWSTFATTLLTLALVIGAFLGAWGLLAQIVEAKRAREAALRPVLSVLDPATLGDERLEIRIQNIGPGPALDVTVLSWFRDTEVPDLVGRYLAGQSVELVCHDGLVEVFHDAVLVATHARRHLPEQEARVRRQALAATPSRPATDHVVIRKVDHNGSVSFAGGDYRAGNAFKGRQVEVCLAGDTVQIWGDGRLLRTHAAKHDRRKEHGAFANPGGRPDRTNAA
ncbi:MAG: hypothetical protein EPO64_04275 [Nitrospirae bacterium]|nr:MAG: hypothetical protein EPO64_04275 [Nitrospirota bacterium]